VKIRKFFPPQFIYTYAEGVLVGIL